MVKFLRVPSLYLLAIVPWFIFCNLKVVSATFLVVCLKKSAFLKKSKKECLWNQEKCFLVHIKSSFRSQGNRCLELQIFKFHDVIKCLNVNKKHILLINLGSKHSLLIKFGQIISYYKKKIIKKFYKMCELKTSSRHFCVCKELRTTSIGK